jgi:hypothetical protein
MEIPKESQTEFEDPELEALVDYLEDWGKERGLIFNLVARIGVGRDCVSFSERSEPHNAIAYNPIDYQSFEYVPEVYSERLMPPADVEDAYHKDNYFCVLRYHGEGNGEVEIEGFKKALKQMKAWTDYLDGLGQVKAVRYRTGAVGPQAMFTGEYGYALKIVE